MTTNTDRILTTMFTRLLQLEIDEALGVKLCAVIDSVIERVGGNFDLSTVQGQNTFRALLCSMVVHGWGNGMHPYHNPNSNLEGQDVEVRVSKDILVSMKDLKSLRYVKKDEHGRVKQALFEPDHNVRIRHQIDEILSQISNEKWKD
jgi:hypothetical protein